MSWRWMAGSLRGAMVSHHRLTTPAPAWSASVSVCPGRTATKSSFFPVRSQLEYFTSRLSRCMYRSPSGLVPWARTGREASSSISVASTFRMAPRAIQDFSNGTLQEFYHRGTEGTEEGHTGEVSLCRDEM